VTIGIIDSGIDTDSPEFAGRLSSASVDVVANRGLDNADSDHGTNVAMIAAAARDNVGVMGIAFQSTIAMFRTDTVGSCSNPDPDEGCTFNDNNIAVSLDRGGREGLGPGKQFLAHLREDRRAACFPMLHALLERLCAPVG
jgi:subtilisin family serine protease